MGGSIQRLHPIAAVERRLEEKATIGGGANYAFSLTILRGGVGTKPHLNPLREKERAEGGVVELATIVALESTNRVET